MAKTFNVNTSHIESRPKKTRQGSSVRTKRSPTSRNGAVKKYRGQGK
tara:strand:+ start:305 stop:445 length:141 start_codon:yes stop_codon:yes gene_type:complete